MTAIGTTSIGIKTKTTALLFQPTSRVPIPDRTFVKYHGEEGLHTTFS